MRDVEKEFDLRFDGPPVKQLGGAPAEAVIASLAAIQRMVFIIGMKAAGRVLRQRIKPSTDVRNEYAVICKSPVAGSYLQPFQISSLSGQITQASILAGERLSETLQAFNSGDDSEVQRVVPNNRERYFLAIAASGLLPAAESGVTVVVREGIDRTVTFNAERARSLLAIYRSVPPPSPEEDEVVGSLWAIDYGRTILTVKPRENDRTVRVGYPEKMEPWLHSIPRQDIRLVGKPFLNRAGDITGFEKLISCSEVVSLLEPISRFQSQGVSVTTSRPLMLPIQYDLQINMFVLQDQRLGIDVMSDTFEQIRTDLLSELDILWRNYAAAPDADLAQDAMALKSELNKRFQAQE